MSHLAVFVFLLVALSGIATVHGQKCEGLRGKPKGYGGRCFSSPYSLTTYTDRPKCDSLLLPGQDYTGCDDPDQGCCIKCSRQTKYCDKGYSGSVGRCECCPSELQVSVVRPGSGCICCKECKKKRRCRRKHGGSHCITEGDPVYNVTWCESQLNFEIKKKQCSGWGCWCCKYDYVL